MESDDAVAWQQLQMQMMSAGQLGVAPAMPDHTPQALLEAQMQLQQLQLQLAQQNEGWQPPMPAAFPALPFAQGVPPARYFPHALPLPLPLAVPGGPGVAVSGDGTRRNESVASDEVEVEFDLANRKGRMIVPREGVVLTEEGEKELEAARKMGEGVKWCKQHARGKCARGKSCKAAHVKEEFVSPEAREAVEEVKRQSELQATTYNRNYKTRLCDAFKLRGMCRFTGTCTFAHGEEELRPRLCSSVTQGGKCAHGDKCEFAHDDKGLSEERCGRATWVKGNPPENREHMMWPPTATEGSEGSDPPVRVPEANPEIEACVQWEAEQQGLMEVIKDDGSRRVDVVTGTLRTFSEFLESYVNNARTRWILSLTEEEIVRQGIELRTPHDTSAPETVDKPPPLVDPAEPSTESTEADEEHRKNCETLAEELKTEADFEVPNGRIRTEFLDLCVNEGVFYVRYFEHLGPDDLGNVFTVLGHESSLALLAGLRKYFRTLPPYHIPEFLDPDDPEVLQKARERLAGELKRANFEIPRESLRMQFLTECTDELKVWRLSLFEYVSPDGFASLYSLLGKVLSGVLRKTLQGHFESMGSTFRAPSGLQR
eukprot:Hpha_TRINITY_DN16275_c2_g7::TRINITY_DN16275_c2_g7_i4::g.16135::m.16135